MAGTGRDLPDCWPRQKYSGRQFVKQRMAVYGIYVLPVQYGVAEPSSTVLVVCAYSVISENL